VAFGTVGDRLAPLVPFLVVVPLVPLAGVAAAFSARLNPSHALVAAAPLSGLQVFFLRSLAVLTSSLVPAVVLGLGLPGPSWLAVAVILPALAVTSVGLVLSIFVDPAAAAGGVGLAWMALSALLAATVGSPSIAFGGAGQGVAAALVAVAAGVLFLRRERIELGWAR
jgi:hypothetical protein